MHSFAEFKESFTLDTHELTNRWMYYSSIHFRPLNTWLFKAFLNSRLFIISKWIFNPIYKHAWFPLQSLTLKKGYEPSQYFFLYVYEKQRHKLNECSLTVQFLYFLYIITWSIVFSSFILIPSPWTVSQKKDVMAPC